MLKNKPITAILAVSDLEKARNFYGTTLGLEAEKDIAGGIMFKAGAGTKLYVYERQAEQRGIHTEASFEVEDVEAEVNELRARGVVFEEYDLPGIKTEQGIATMGKAKSAWFKDPDENILAISSMSA